MLTITLNAPSVLSTSPSLEGADACNRKVYWWLKHLIHHLNQLLFDTTMPREAVILRKLREQVESFQVPFEHTKFVAEDPIVIFDCSTRFLKEADTSVVSKANLLLILPELLCGWAEINLRSVHNGAQSGGITCWLEVDSHFLRTNVFLAAILDALNDLSSICQRPRENEIADSKSIKNATQKCGLYIRGQKDNLDSQCASTSQQTIVMVSWIYEPTQTIIQLTSSMFARRKILAFNSHLMFLELRTEKRGRTISLGNYVSE